MSATSQSERTRVLMATAQDEATALGHEYVATEHVLLALLTERGGLVEQVFAETGVDTSAARERIVGTVRPGRQRTADHALPLTSRTSRVLALAEAEANALGSDAIEPEHMLLGMLADGTGIGAQVLLDDGLTLARAREATRRLVDTPRT